MLLTVLESGIHGTSAATVGAALAFGVGALAPVVVPVGILGAIAGISLRLSLGK